MRISTIYPCVFFGLRGIHRPHCKAWTAAHISFYATNDGIGWYQVDDVKLISDTLSPVRHTGCFDLNAPWLLL